MQVDEGTIDVFYAGPAADWRELAEGVVVSGSTVMVCWLDFMLEKPRPATSE